MHNITAGQGKHLPLGLCHHFEEDSFMDSVDSTESVQKLFTRGTTDHVYEQTFLYENHEIDHGCGQHQRQHDTYFCH